MVRKKDKKLTPKEFDDLHDEVGTPGTNWLLQATSQDRKLYTELSTVALKSFRDDSNLAFLPKARMCRLLLNEAIDPEHLKNPDLHNKALKTVTEVLEKLEKNKKHEDSPEVNLKSATLRALEKKFYGSLDHLLKSELGLGQERIP